MTRSQPISFFDRIVAWSLRLRLPWAICYLLATVVIGAVGWGRILFVPDTLPWLLFIPATIAIALVLGKGPGLFAAALSTATGIASLGSLAHPTWVPRQQWIAASLFLAVMVGLVMLTAEFRESLRRARRLNEELIESERQAVDRQAFLSGVLASSTDCIKVLDLDGKLTFMSEGGQRVMEVSDFNDVAGCPWPDFWQGAGNAEARAAIEAARQGEARSFIGKANTYRGIPKWWHVAVSPIAGPDGRPDRILSVSRDITHLRASEEERDRFVRLAENSTDFVGMARTDGSMFYLNDAAKRLVGLEHADTAKLAITDFFPPEQAGTVIAEVLPAVDRVGHWSGEVSFRHFGTGEPIPVLFSVFPLTDGTGARVGYGTVTRDFRDRKAAEEQQKLLTGELAHRLKNMFSVVQAIAFQTLGPGEHREEVSNFNARLKALADAQDVLTRENWSAASLRKIAEGVLTTFDQTGRITLAGPDVTIGPRAALALSLLLHELATNAVKYGALSVTTGNVGLVWSLAEKEGKQDLTMSWVERGGLPAVQPTRRGFGSRIIRMGLTGSGGVDLCYGEAGFSAQMTARLDQLQQA